MGDLLDNKDSQQKIGVHINSDFQVAIVSSDVSENSVNITERSRSYLIGIKELLSRSTDVVDSAQESAVKVEEYRHRVLAAQHFLLSLQEGKSPARKTVYNMIAGHQQQYEMKKKELEQLLKLEISLQTELDDILTRLTPTN